MIYKHRRNKNPFAQTSFFTVDLHFPVATTPMGPAVRARFAVRFGLRLRFTSVERDFVGQCENLWCKLQIAPSLLHAVITMLRSLQVTMQSVVVSWIRWS